MDGEGGDWHEVKARGKQGPVMLAGEGVGIPFLVQLEAKEGFEERSDMSQYMCNPQKAQWALALWL